MTRPRSQQIALEATPYYHCISRCVRRAFLCGRDEFSGRSFEHRKAWVVEKLAVLTDIFAIDLCAYAVMSNHYHLVIRVNLQQAETWSSQEVAQRWMRLYKGPSLVRDWLSGSVNSEAQEQQCQEIIENWRSRLCNISWFMRCLNEHLARKANQEDGCTGRFWEGRFKSQALLDTAAVLSCMAYVDLNPIRAGIADLPEHSDYTSVQQRVAEQKTSVPANQQFDHFRSSKKDIIKSTNQLPRLAPFDNKGDQPIFDGISDYPLDDYLQLVDWTGRAIRPDKRGTIPEQMPAILYRLNVDKNAWIKHMRPRSGRMLVAIGAVDKLKIYIAATGRNWLVGRLNASALSPG